METPAIRERILYFLAQISDSLAADVAKGLGMQVPAKLETPLNQNVSADQDPKDLQPKKFSGKPFVSQALLLVTPRKLKFKPL